MYNKDKTNGCSMCGRSQNEWNGEGISVGSETFCNEQCARTAQTGKRDARSPGRAITEVEKLDAYDANDMQPPFDEAPVPAGGARSQKP
jgi:hypothetical protein